MTRNLPKAWPALWAFANHDGVQPTNNHAERRLRSTVIYRKLSLGSQSETSKRRIARPLSAHSTCQLQRRSLFAYLTDTIAAHARGDPVPQLSRTTRPTERLRFLPPMGDTGLELAPGPQLRSDTACPLISGALRSAQIRSLKYHGKYHGESTRTRSISRAR
jgi:hypothetical protein